jgi:transposase, IS605 orfB family
MYLTKKIRLLPTAEQEKIFWKSAGVARWSYNFFLSYNQEKYNEWLEDNAKEKFVGECNIRKYINNTLKTTTHTWLKDVGSNVMKQAVKDANNALMRFFKKTSNYPKYKSRKKSKPSFYVNYETLKRTPNGFRGERIGIVKTRESLPKIPKNQKYVNPRITYDGKFWFLSVGYEVEQKQIKLTEEKIGIDLGLKDLVIKSDTNNSSSKIYRNINKGYRIKLLKKQLKRAERKLSRKILDNIESYDENRVPTYIRPLKDCKNIQKQIHVIQDLYRKLTNIRNNYIHQVTTEIVKTKPSRIVLEDLNISGMMKNKYRAKAIAEAKWYEFRRQILYKSEIYGIEVVLANRFFPSSQLCSSCGFKNKAVKNTKIREWDCPECGKHHNRDINAAINLANYQI